MRALRVVPRAWDRREPVADCPQPETPIRPIQYGAAQWGKLPPTPTADQLTIRARVQSMRSRGGKVAELLSYEDSLAYLARSAKPSKHSVTVPQPRAPAARPSVPPVAGHAIPRAGQNTGAGVRQAARMHVGVHRPFSGQTVDVDPPARGEDDYTPPTVRGLSGATPEHPTSLPASPGQVVQSRGDGAWRKGDSVTASHTAAADAAHRPTGDPSYAARGGESVPRNYSEER